MDLRKVDEETESFRHQRVSYDFKTALQRARQAKKMTQAELAQKLNVKPSIVSDYETGRAIPDPQLVARMNRVLGVTLPKTRKQKKPKEEKEDE